jgi:precorrin-6A/cobalt-precorrin-6A reductase
VAKKVLILGGTAEAARLARRAVDAFGTRATIITSLAGRTRTRADLPGRVRVGGFGGAEGLADYLEADAIDVVIDATHPFAAAISGHAAVACARTGVPRLALVRPPWRLDPGTAWREVDDLKAAATALAGAAKRAFLTTGRGGLEAFAAVPDAWFLVRLMEAPERPLPLPDHQVIVQRPPFTVDSEKTLMREHRIDTLVAKNSGGITEAKITAARDLGVRVVLIRRPPPPPGDAVETVDAALAWLAARLR